MKLPASLPDIDPALARLRAGADRLSPYRARALAELRKSRHVATALDGTASTWTRLVEAFCETIDPHLARWFPELRLVACVGEGADLVLHRVDKNSDGIARATPVETDAEALAATTWTAIELRLRPDQVLRRTLALPGASRDFLAPIIEHRLERLTPWKPDRVLYGYRMVESAEANAVSVELVATSRDIVAAPLAKLATLGLAPTAIGAEASSPTEPLEIDLQGGGLSRTARPESRKVVSRMAMATLGALAILALVTGLAASNADATRAETTAKLAKARRLLRGASFSDAQGREKTMLDAKQPDRAMIVLVDRLAAAIPADTFLREMAVGPLKVRLVGTSGDAPALIGKIETTGLRNVRFSSAITREADGRDTFEITADRVPVDGGASP